MENKTRKSKVKEKANHQEVVSQQDDFFDSCLREGLIEKTQNGFYFTPEFFETIQGNLNKKYSAGKKKASVAS